MPWKTCQENSQKQRDQSREEEEEWGMYGQGMGLWCWQEGTGWKNEHQGLSCLSTTPKTGNSKEWACFCTAQCAVVPWLCLFSLELCSQPHCPLIQTFSSSAKPHLSNWTRVCQKIQTPAWPPTSPKHLNLIFLGIQPKSTDQSREDHFSACLLLP